MKTILQKIKIILLIVAKMHAGRKKYLRRQENVRADKSKKIFGREW